MICFTMASEPGPSSLGHDKPSEPGKSAFFILCAPQDRFRQEDYTDPSKELFEDFLAHMDGKLSHTNPKILSGIDMASRTTAGKCAVLFLDSVPKIIPEFHKHMTSLLIDNHKFMMLERKKKKMMPSSSAPVEGQAAHKPFSVINMYVSERAVGIPDEKLLSVVMKQNHFPGTVQLVHLKKVGEGRQVKMTGDLELMNHLSRFPISHKFSLGTSRVCLKSDNRRLPSSQQIEPSYLTPGIPTATDYAQGGPSLPHAPQVNPRDHLQPTFGSVAVKAHPRAPSMCPPKFANSHEPPVHTSSSKKGKKKKKKKKGKNNRAFEEEEEKTPILPTYQELLKYSTGVADGPEGYPGQEIVVVIAGEGDVLGTIDPCGVWRANGGKFASLKKSEIDKITAEINKKRVKESIKEEAQLMLENDCAEEEAEDSVPEQRYEHFSGVGNVLGTIKPGGIWRANKGKFGKMSRAQIRNKLAKEEKCLEPALLTEVKGIPGEKKTLILEKHGRVSGIFDSAGNWRSNMLKFNSMTKEAIERKDLDQEQLKERFRLNAELKRSSEALSDKKEEHFYGAPGTTKFFYFHGEGNLLGTYDNFSNWVACTGRFQGKSKGFIRQTIAKEQESNVLKELKTIVAKKGYSHKAAHGTPGDKKVLKFTGNVEVMGTYNTDGVWIADEGTEWAGRTRGSIAGA